MRCKKCNRYLGFFLRYCPRCGTAVTPKERKKSLITFGIWTLLFLLMTPLFYFMFLSENTFAENNFTNLHILGIAAFVSLVIVEIFAVTYFIAAAIIRGVRRQPILSGIIAATVLVLGGFALYVYQTDVSGKQFSDSLTLIQDNLVELQVAKITGDSLLAKKPIITTSWEKIGLQSQMVAGRLKYLEIPEKLIPYNEATIAWSESITTAAAENTKWKELKDNLGEFELKLSEKEAQKLFEAAVKKISELKEFGDSAIQAGDKTAMLYIGARLRVQKHWLESILASSEKNSPVSALLIPQTFALTFGENVPKVGKGCAVDVEYYKETGKTRCLGEGANTQQTQPTQPTQPVKQTTPTQPTQPEVKTTPETEDSQVYTQNQTQQQIKNDGVSQNLRNQNTVNQPGEKEEYKTKSGGLAGTYDSRSQYRLCIGRGGVSSGNSPTNVYCIEEAIQAMTGIDASAIGFAQGNSKAKENWNNSWHNLEGIGITTGETTPSSAGRSPSLQAFYDSCSAKGGIVGGTGTVKIGLPTTESGYTCEYKNGQTTGCWDFLTYSGGRYMGGNPGCAQQGTLPDFSNVKTSGGEWDGDYAVPGGTMECAGGFSYSIPIPARVGSVRNNILATTVGMLPINGNVAIYNLSTSSQQEGITSIVNEIDSFRFYKNGKSAGVTATYDASVVLSKDGESKAATCYARLTGVRQ